ncbi:MAG: ParB/RepB/Spo0J family partition protein [Planctomycetota bacterium]|jgi:ParB family chromosome partitioning protein
MVEKRLGRGLEYLITDGVKEGEEILRLPIETIQPNPYQPRQDFDEEAEKALAESIRLHGILQPIIVRRGKGTFEIVAGERRWRAAKKAGLREIPCLRRRADDEEMLALALIENIQRQDLDPIEKATAFKDMMNRLSLTQDGVSKRLGLSRPAVANFLRLLTLPKAIQESVSRGTITFGHAKAIMALEDPEDQEALHRKILAIGLSVRATEKEAKKTAKKGKKRTSRSTPHIKELENTLMNKLGTKVRIQPSGKGGKIIIDFYSNEDFERISDLIG